MAPALARRAVVAERMSPARRPPQMRRSWLFLPGADEARLRAAAGMNGDVLIQELEDFTPAPLRPQARALSADILRLWRAAGRVAAARVNPLEICGRDDLAAVMAGRPDVVMLAMAQTPEQIHALDEAISFHERALGVTPGATEIVPNIETAKALVAAGAIAGASPRVSAMLLATEDLAADLGAERTPQGGELDYARRRFLVECVAAGVVAIDCPFTYADATHLDADLRFARGLGYTAKSLVNPDHLGTIHAALTPGAQDVARARRMIEAFDAARATGADRAEVDGLMVEVPTARAARRLLARHEALSRYDG